MAKAKRAARKASTKQASSAKRVKKKRASRIAATDQPAADTAHGAHSPGGKKKRKSAAAKSSAKKERGKPRSAKQKTGKKARTTEVSTVAEEKTPANRKSVPHCNGLDGKRWIQNSISVWSDIRKSGEENRLKHPAMFPGMLVERLVESFLRPEGEKILDPFCGSGSTIVEAERLGKTGIGIELSPDYAKMARRRVADVTSSLFAKSRKPRSVIHEGSAEDVTRFVDNNSIDLCITSPPYWDILNQRRTADYKDVRHYGNLDGDLGTISDYEQFLESLKQVFAEVYAVLKPGAYCCVIVMDLRKKNRFFPLHSDLAAKMTELGFIFDDLIIWNRQSEYNNLRPLGFPAVFRVNKVHEFVVLLQKPREK